MYNLLEQKFRSLAIERGGILLFDPDTALKFVQASEVEGYKILGIDGFFLGKNTTRPSMIDSIDFSCDGCVSQKIYNQALEFLERYKGSDIYFEIVCEE